MNVPVLQIESIFRIINEIIDLIPWDAVVVGLLIMLGADALGVYPFQDWLVDLATVAWNWLVDVVWGTIVSVLQSIWNALLDQLNPV
jgi:hypothetical protein